MLRSQPGGRDIFPTFDHAESTAGAPLWEILKSPTDGSFTSTIDKTLTQPIKITAVPMSHSVGTVGYVCEEIVDYEGAPESGRMDAKIARNFVQKNFEALRGMGYKDPNKVLGVLKNLKTINGGGGGGGGGEEDPVFEVFSKSKSLVDSIKYSEYMVKQNEGGGGKKGRKVSERNTASEP